ncbi:DUF732 domain-containing protein [Nocardia vaccinii]|uniref:DUF732 domain-containing protein n=1 Tax=Nocardia vaccinii TaxID=1822 RepID=UPI00082FFCA0|nr:DUF732 domain-containing protein [Nocardia vaccinii]
MNRITGRIAAIAVAVICPVVALAGAASADPGRFLGDLNKLGYSQNTPAERDSAVQRGYSICDDLAAGNSKTDAMGILERKDPSLSGSEAAAWVVASADALCPQYR